MEDLNKTIGGVLNQLNELSFQVKERIELDKIERLKQQLKIYFPQSDQTIQFKGKIENILIEMNHKFSDRIQLLEEEYTILMNVYTAHQTSILMGDVQQLQDVIQLAYPRSKFAFEILKTDAIASEEFLIILEFKS